MANPVAGFTILPGLQVSAYGGSITALKVFNFTLTDTGSISSTGSTGGGPVAAAGDRVYTVGGMTTDDIPFLLHPSTGAFGFNSATSPGYMLAAPRINSTSTAGGANLAVSWFRAGSTSGAAVGGTATGPITANPGMSCNLFTMSVYAPTASTTT